MAKRNTAEQSVYNAKLAIENSLIDPVMMEMFRRYRYDEERFGFGRTLYIETRDLISKQIEGKGQQVSSTHNANKVWEEANAVFTPTFKIAKIAFKGDMGARTTLRLDGQRKRSRTGGLAQAIHFYNCLLGNEEYQAGMDYFGYTPEILNQEYDLVKLAEQASLKQDQERGDSQNLTKERDAKLDELNKWMSDFKAVAKVALAEKPQLLEKLGFGAIR